MGKKALRIGPKFCGWLVVILMIRMWSCVDFFIIIVIILSLHKQYYNIYLFFQLMMVIGWHQNDLILQNNVHIYIYFKPKQYNYFNFYLYLSILIYSLSITSRN